MKPYRITVICAGSRTQFTGIYKSAIDATLAGMDQLNQSDPNGRVEVKPISAKKTAKPPTASQRKAKTALQP